ncbi:MAG: hypothetical protein SGJ13_12890 [Actinomycetota bacterium]|nr:hypothetical protein [Actinomycetota bacterium]
METSSQYLVQVYIAYAAIALILTVWLAQTLYRNGAVFLEEVFDSKEIAVAVNRLLVTGFFMINLGYAMFLLKSNDPTDATEAIEIIMQKLGVLLLSLAAVHFVNVYVFWRLRHRNEVKHMPPPVVPQRTVTVG